MTISEGQMIAGILILCAAGFAYLLLVNGGNPHCMEGEKILTQYRANCPSCQDAQNGQRWILNKSEGGNCDVSGCEILETQQICA